MEETPASVAALSEWLGPETIARLTELAVAWTMNAIGALVVLVVGLWVAGRLKKTAIKWVERSPRFDQTLGNFFGSIVYYLIVAFVVIAVLGMFGIQTTGLAALIGAAGLAIGLALQGTLSHVASGVMLLAFRPFKVGDFVEVADQSGTVKVINLFTTELATPDNVKIIVPNGDVWGSAVKNYSANPTRRIEIVMGISYDDDIDRSMQSIESELSKETRIHADPEPQIVVGNLGDSSVDLIVRVWADTSDYWAVKFDLTKALKQRFDEDGITIPYPTQTHLVEAQAAEAT